MRRGFTMIELIFVIVIIGILAVIAISKLNATRDDAKIVTELQNLSTCIQDVGAAYTATGTEKKDSAACGNLKCFTVDLGSSTTDGNISVDRNSTNSEQWCTDAETKAESRKLKGTHIFGGSRIKE